MRLEIKQDGDYTVITINETVLHVKDDENPISAIKRVLGAMGLLTADGSPKRLLISNEELPQGFLASYERDVATVAHVIGRRSNVCKECNDEGFVEDYTDSAGFGGAPAIYTCPSCRGKKNE